MKREKKNCNNRGDNEKAVLRSTNKLTAVAYCFAAWCPLVRIRIPMCGQIMDTKITTSNRIYASQNNLNINNFVGIFPHLKRLSEWHGALSNVVNASALTLRRFVPQLEIDTRIHRPQYSFRSFRLCAQCTCNHNYPIRRFIKYLPGDNN